MIGKSIAEYLSNDDTGIRMKEFRATEHRVVDDFRSTSGVVLATGGGLYYIQMKIHFSNKICIYMYILRAFLRV